MSDKLEIVTVPKNLYYHEVAYVRGLERERDVLREALKKIAEADYEYDDDYDVPAAIARAALEAKP